MTLYCLRGNFILFSLSKTVSTTSRNAGAVRRLRLAVQPPRSAWALGAVLPDSEPRLIVHIIVTRRWTKHCQRPKYFLNGWFWIRIQSVRPHLSDNDCSNRRKFAHKFCGAKFELQSFHHFTMNSPHSFCKSIMQCILCLSVSICKCFGLLLDCFHSFSSSHHCRCCCFVFFRCLFFLVLFWSLRLLANIIK